MMIQFNLLPDVKIQYIKTRRLKRVMLMSALAASAVSVLVLFLAFSYTTVQKTHLGNLDKDIVRLTEELNNTPDLTKILSVQNQLNTLPELYNGRPAIDRLPDYLDRTTPAGVGIVRLTLDLSANTMEVNGAAGTLEEVNSYVDTLKFTTFKTDEEGSEPTPAFSSVVLTQFGRDREAASYTITFAFDPVIFDITKKIELLVPQQVTTHAKAPANNLFSGQDGTTEGSQ